MVEGVGRRGRFGLFTSLHLAQLVEQFCQLPPVPFAQLALHCWTRIMASCQWAGGLRGLPAGEFYLNAALVSPRLRSQASQLFRTPVKKHLCVRAASPTVCRRRIG
jgi:hypothetical protein